MTLTTNARVAGFTFLLYIAVAASELVVFAGATSAEGIAAKLALIGQHATEVRIAIVLTLLTCFAALVLAVTLYRITRDQYPDLAMLALTCRVGEGVVSGILISPPARTDHSRPTELAGRRRLGPARGSPSPAARRIRRRSGHLAHVVTNGGVRGAAGALAAHQRRRRARPRR